MLMLLLLKTLRVIKHGVDPGAEGYISDMAQHTK